MDIILGATGHVGSEVAKNLLAQKIDVMVVTHNQGKKQEWNRQGAKVAVVDIHQTEKLSEVFNQGQRLFFLNPPADPSTDTVKEEKITVYSILEALKSSNIEKVVAESTYGAQPGDAIGDLGVLQEMEEGLKELGIATSVIRAAYYMSNWDASLEDAKTKGEIISFYPADFKLPMVAPADLGFFAAQLLNEPNLENEIYYVEGPERYSANDVAEAFSEAIGKPVKVRVLERGEWLPFLMEQGFSQAAAESMEAMTEITLEQKYDMPKFPMRGMTSLREYIYSLVTNH